MKGWARKIRRREKVEFILPGSTTANKNRFYFSVMALAYILAPRSGRPKTQGPGSGREKSERGRRRHPCESFAAGRFCTGWRLKPSVMSIKTIAYGVENVRFQAHPLRVIVWRLNGKTPPKKRSMQYVIQRAH